MLYGAFVALGYLIGVVAERLFTANYLERKADRANRTAAKIGNGFYYIVPDSEYADTAVRLAADNWAKEIHK